MAAQEAVVRVRSERWDSVTEREELVGRFRLGSLLPQYLQLQSDLVVHALNGKSKTYLITAMLTGAVVVARKTVFSAVPAIVSRGR